MGYFIEEGIKLCNIQSMVELQAASKAMQSGFIGGNTKKKEDVLTITTYH